MGNSCGDFVLRAQQNPGGQGVAAFKRLSLEQLMDVEVTSVSRKVEKLSDTASAIQVVSGEELRRAGADQLPSALRLFSNLAVAQVDSRQWAITARGFNNTLANKMLVLLDGRTIYTPLYAGVFWDAQATFMPDLERIEVISGPGATQWGSNAVNGVINITTKNSRETQGGLLFGGAGTELKETVGARYGGAFTPNVHYRIYAQHTRRDGSALPDGGDAGDDWKHTQTGFRVDWDTPSSDVFTFQGDLYTGRVAMPATRDLKMEGGNLLGRWTRMFAADSGIKVQLYYDRAFRRIPGAVTDDLETFDLDFQHQVPVLPTNNLVWGLNFRAIQDEVTNTTALAFLPPRVSREWYSVFVQDNIAWPNEEWQLTFGSKFERNPYTGSEIQPSVRLGWKMRPSTLIWGAISRAVRAPSRIDREVFSPGVPPFLLAGGPNFTSEKLLAYKLGIRSHPRPDLNYSVSAFFHDYDDLRSLEPGASALVIANGLVGKSYGAELAVEYAVSTDWRLRLGYAELRVESRPKPGSLDRTSVRSQSLDPNHQLLLISQHNFFDRLFFDPTLRYVAPLRNQQVPGYTELDVRLGWQLSAEVELSLTGRNLLHRRHREFGTPAAGREIERSGSAMITWRF